MAIAYVNSQGTKLWINTTIPTGTPTYTNVSTGGKLVGCPQSVGAIEETRSVTEYKCLSSNDTVKALGAISRGNIQIGLLFDPTDTAGQDALKTAFQSNTEVLVGIEFPDTGVTNGTTMAFIGLISTISLGIEMDAAVTYTVTVEISSAVTEIAAA